MNYFFGEVAFNRASNVAKASFNFNEERIFQHRHNQYSALLGFGGGNDFKVYLVTGLVFDWYKLYSGYKYSDGFISYGDDRVLNGVFGATPQMSVLFGLRSVFIIPKTPLGININIEYTGNFIKVDHGPIYDPTFNNLENNVGKLPQHYQQGHDPLQYDGDYVITDWNFFRVNIGVSFNLNLNK